MIVIIVLLTVITFAVETLQLMNVVYAMGLELDKVNVIVMVV